MKREIFDNLAQYDEKLMSVANGAQNVRYVTFKMIDDIAEAYNDITGKVLTKSMRSCNSCLFKVIREVAADYAAMKNKPKRGRKKAEE